MNKKFKMIIIVILIIIISLTIFHKCSMYIEDIEFKKERQIKHFNACKFCGYKNNTNYTLNNYGKYYDYTINYNYKYYTETVECDNNFSIEILPKINKNETGIEFIKGYVIKCLKSETNQFVGEFE